MRLNMKKLFIVGLVILVFFYLVGRAVNGKKVKSKSRGDVENAISAAGISSSKIQYSGSESLALQSGGILIAYVYEGDGSGIGDNLYNQMLQQIQDSKFTGKSDKVEKKDYKYIIMEGTDSYGEYTYGGVYKVGDRCIIAGTDRESEREIVKTFLDALGYPHY